jgi:hypothetical protein
MRLTGRAGWPAGALAAAVLATALLGLAYQVQPALRLTIGDETSDKGVVQDFYADERREGDGLPFRWTRGASTIALPAWGPGPYRLAVEMAAPLNPEPAVRLAVNGRPLAQTVLASDFRRYEYTIPAALAPDGALRLTFESATFSPPNDRRRLGVVVHAVELTPLGGWPVRPPAPALAIGAGLALLAYAALALAGWGWRAALLGSAGLTAALAGLLAGARLLIVPVLDELPFIGALALAATALLRLGLAVLARRPGWRPPAWEGRWLLTLVGAALLIRLAATLHPQMDIIDLGFHVNRYTDVAERGMLFLKIRSAEWGGRETVYSPAAYLAMLPLGGLIPDKHRMIRVFTALLETSRLLLVFALARWGSGSGRAALLAALLFVSLPLGILPFSWGITSNLFGEWWATALLLLLAAGWRWLTRPPLLALGVAVATLALLAHPGVLLLTGAWLAVLTAGLALAWLRGRGREGAGARGGAEAHPHPTPLPQRGRGDRGWSGEGAASAPAPAHSPAGAGALSQHWERAGGEGRAAVAAPPCAGGYALTGRRVAALALLALLAAALAVGLFYRVDAPVMLAQAGATLTQRLGDQAAGGDQPRRWRVSGSVDDKSLGLGARYVTDWRLVPLEGMIGYAREAWAYYWGWPLVAAAAGWWLIGRGERGRHLRRLTLAWAATAALFALVGLLLNLYVRYMLFLLPVVCVLAGVALEALAQRGRAGAALTAALLAATVLAGGWLWYQRVVVFFH